MNLTEVIASGLIRAAPPDVYDAWLDTKRPGGPWFGAEAVILNPVEGGLFYHSVRHIGKTWAHFGRFIKLDRPQLIEHTWMSESTLGVETRLTVTFEPKNDQTLITIRHCDVPDTEMGRQHEFGWKFVIEGLQARFDHRPH